MKPRAVKKSKSTDNLSVNTTPVDVLKDEIEKVNDMIIVEGNKTPRVTTNQLEELNKNSKPATKAPSSPRYKLSFHGKKSTALSNFKKASK